MSNARFSIIPSSTVANRRISDAQFRTLAALGTFGDKNGWCWPSLKKLAIILGKSKQAVSKDIQHLKNIKVIEVYKRFNKETKSQRSNKYRILFDTPSTPEVDPLSTVEVDPPSTPEVDHNAPLLTPQNNAPLKERQAATANNIPAYDWLFLSPKQAKSIPEIKKYCDLTGLYPGKAKNKRVFEIIHSNNLLEVDLKQFWDEWLDRGYNPTGLGWLTDWASTGKITGRKKKTKRKMWDDEKQSFAAIARGE